MKGPLLRYNCLWLSILLSFSVFAQEKEQVQLRVLDENNSPLIGVFVYTDKSATTTNFEGIATLELEPTSIVTFEYLGYQDLTLSYNKLIAHSFLCQMIPDEKLLEEVVIIGRTDAREVDLPYNVTRIKSESIFSSNAQNTADALALNSGAYIQKSQLGGGSPILRGFEANKVLLVVDGVRMNNAIYRNGHLQNAITIDPAILQQMEVIYGPGSLLYGSEALGGVIHFRTMTPLLELSDQVKSKNRVNAMVRYNTADQEKTSHIDHMYSTKKFGLLTSVSYTDRGNLRAGGNRLTAYPDFGKRSEYVAIINNQDSIITNENPNIQIGTAYNQLDIFQKYVYQASPQLKTELNLQYSTSSNIPRYDNLSEYRNGRLRFAEWYYGPQERLLIAPKVSWSKKTSAFDKMNLILSYQKIEESRYSRPLREPALEEQIEGVQVLGATLDFNKRINDNNKLVYGTDLHYNEVTSDAQAKTPTSEGPLLSRYPSGGSQLINIGAFIQHNWQNTDSTLVWANGLRYSTQKVTMRYDQADPFTWPAYFYEGIISNNSAVVGITGINFQKGPYLAKVSTGTAFRSPNVDDLAKIRVNGDEITIPNPDLNSEKVWNSEITVGYRSPQFTIGLTGFYTRLSDAIVRESFTLPNGASEYFTGIDTLQVTANVNANSGVIKGVSLNITARPITRLELNSSINIQRGTQSNGESNSSPLGHIPPNYGRNSIRYKATYVTISLNHSYNLWKRIEDYGGSVDNPDLATLDGAPAWHSLGLATQWTIGKEWTINIAAENLTDRHYRPFASGVSAAGRHLILAVKYSITK